MIQPALEMKNGTEISLSPKGISWGHGYHTHGVAQAWAWKTAPKSWLLLCPQSEKFLFSWCQQLPGGLMNWGKLFVLGSCLFVFTQSELFLGFDLFATRCFHGQLIVESDMFSPIKYDTQQHSYLHAGEFIHTRGKKHFQIWIWVQLVSSSASTKINRSLPVT